MRSSAHLTSSVFQPGTIESQEFIADRDITSLHQPVLLKECVNLVTENLLENCKENNQTPVIVDGTVGLGGHDEAFLEACSDCLLVGIDRDEEALQFATSRLERFSNRFIPVHDTFGNISAILNRLATENSIPSTQVAAVFLDLGISSLQLAQRDRGFSYSVDEPLDMRMNPQDPLTAADIINTWDSEQLTHIFREYGQERWSAPIAKAIVEDRQNEPFKTTSQLSSLIDRVVPKKNRPAGNPAKRVFQALRIEVNSELSLLKSVLPQIVEHLQLHGRIVIESYHSLEDKIVKTFFAQGIHPFIPAGLPVIPSEYEPYFKDLTRGSLMASDREKESNPRSASVRLRAVELVRTPTSLAINKMKEARL